jgi:hypothetical protein
MIWWLWLTQWRGCGSKRHGWNLNLWNYPSVSLRDWGKPRKICFRADIWRRGPPEYEAGLPTTRLWRLFPVITINAHNYCSKCGGNSVFMLSHYMTPSFSRKLPMCGVLVCDRNWPAIRDRSVYSVGQREGLLLKRACCPTWWGSFCHLSRLVTHHGPSSEGCPKFPSALALGQMSKTFFPVHFNGQNLCFLFGRSRIRFCAGHWLYTTDTFSWFSSVLPNEIGIQN